MINLSPNLNLSISLNKITEGLPFKQNLPSAQSIFSTSANFLTTNTQSVCQSITKWSGIKGVANGVKALKHGEIKNGLHQIATEGMPIVLLTLFTAAVALKKINDFNEERPDPTNPTESHVPVNSNNPIKKPIPKSNPPPTTPFKAAYLIGDLINQCTLPYDNKRIPRTYHSQIHLENINPQIGKRRITFISAYDDGIKDYAQHVIPNQQAYAAKQGYNYIAYSGNLTPDQGDKRAPYWSKIVALNDQLKKTQEGEWLVWGDASAIFTNTKKNFDEIIDKYGQDKDIIVTTDPQVPINNAVFIIKNTPWTKEWIKDVWNRSDLALPGEGKCWSWGQPFCHYEQQAMTELWQINQDVQDHTARIPNNIMNSFYRYSHWDPYRRIPQDYEGDTEDSRWHSGDFVCKVTGMDKDRRLKIIEYVTQNCIDKPCDFKQF